MKEYLVKNIHGDYVVTDHHSGFDVSRLTEIPEGAECAILGSEGNVYFWKSDSFIGGTHVNWVDMGRGYNAEWYLRASEGSKLIWRRHTQPEELPFVDSLNDQYAEIERVRKHRHYFKDVSNIAEIDVYTVLKLFDVTDPCLQHIIKKALCAGKRGHKDMMEDLQNIVDTAIRAVELNS